jgi:DNA-binding transcriptional regulator LsrR (DeoR family)
MTSQMKQQQIEWRRARVELSSEGYSRSEICQKLQLDRVTVHRDIQFLRQQAQENLHRHIHEVVPEEYQKCMVGMKRNLKQTLEIAETTADPRVKLQARAIANDCHRYIMDLCTNAGIVSDALKFMEKKREQLDTLKKIDERIEDLEEDKTANGIF